jgi:hypothetical protein
MKQALELSVDEGTEEAWTRFRRRLADRIAQLDIGDSLLVEVEGDDEDDGCTPYVQASSDDGVRAQAEVCSNRYLHPRHRLDKASRRLLRELGWRRPSSHPETHNYHLEFELSHADRLAVMMVRALREVFGVVHPAFLTGCRIDLEGDVDPGLADPTSPGGVEPLAVTPADKDDLDRLVDDALAPVFGDTPRRDPDGDIGVVSGSAMVFVRVLRDRPMIHLFAELAVALTEPERARFEVQVLNRDWRFAKFVLVDDMVQAHIYVPAAPFAAEHLRQALTMMCEMADAVDHDLAFRVGGHTFLQSSDSDTQGGPDA